MSHRPLSVVLASLLIVVSLGAARREPVVPRAVDTVATATIREVTVALTAVEMEGRGTGQPGGARAAAYLARRFAAAGAEPLGESGSLQTVPLALRAVDTASMVTLDDGRLRFAVDYLMFPPLRATNPPVSGQVTFVAWGVSDPALGRDDLAGVALEGRVVFLLNGGRPADVDQRAWDGAADRAVVLRNLAARGVVAAIMIPGAGTFEGAARFLGRPGMTLAKPPSGAHPIPLFVVSPMVAARIFARSGTSLAEATGLAVAGQRVSRELSTRFAARVVTESVPLTGHNVVAAIRGRDATLGAQAVVYSAHYDGFGREPNGAVRPGAADNALGVAKLVALAEAFARQPTRPRRTIIFFAPTGEEYGNLGTEYWLDHPTWPLSTIAVNINFDGIGTDVFGPVRRVTDYGITYSDAGETVQAVLAARGMALAPDGAPEQGFFQRSDHYSFTKRGIPPVYLIGNAGTEGASRRAGRFLAEIYHTAGDTIHADWWWDGARDLAMVGYQVGRRLADATRMPEWVPTSPYQLGRAALLRSPERP